MSRYVCEITGLVGARSEDRAPAPRLAGLITLWANLHGGHVFGLGLAALFVLGGLRRAIPFLLVGSGKVCKVFNSTPTKRSRLPSRPRRALSRA